MWVTLFVAPPADGLPPSNDCSARSRTRASQRSPDRWASTTTAARSCHTSQVTPSATTTAGLARADRTPPYVTWGGCCAACTTPLRASEAAPYCLGDSPTRQWPPVRSCATTTLPRTTWSGAGARAWWASSTGTSHPPVTDASTSPSVAVRPSAPLGVDAEAGLVAGRRSVVARPSARRRGTGSSAPIESASPTTSSTG
jgi:hypothetical protein